MSETGDSAAGTVPPPASAGSVRIFSDVAWRAVAAAFAFNGVLFGAWASRVPAFKARFELGAGELGLVLLCLAAGAIVSFPLAGYLSERWGAARTTSRAALLYGPSLVLIALSSNAFVLAAALFALGALHGGMDVAMNGWAARVEERLRRPSMSGFHALFSLGAGLGAGSGYLAAELGTAPLGHFLVVAGASGVPALWLMRRGTPPARTMRRARERATLALPRGPLLLVGLIAFGVAMGEGAMADWSAVLLLGTLSVGEAEASLGFAAFSTAMVVTRLLGDRLTARVGTVRTARYSGLVATLGLGVVMLADSLTLALAGFVLIGCGYAVVMPLVFSRAARDREVPSGPAIASVATLAYGGMLLGPVLVGFIAALSSLATAFGVLAMLAFASAVLARHLRA